MSSLRSGSGRWQWRRVRRVEGLHPSLVVAVERRHRAVRSKAEVVASRVGEPGTDLIQIDAHPVSVDQRRRERLRHDQPEGVVGHAVVVGCEVADVLGGAKWGARLLDQEHGECGVGGQTRGLHVENVEAAEVGGQPDGDVYTYRQVNGFLRHAPGVAGRHARIARTSGPQHDVAIAAAALRRGAVPPTKREDDCGSELGPKCRQPAVRNLVDPLRASGYMRVSARIAPALWGRSSVGRALEWHSRGRGFDSLRLHSAILCVPGTLPMLPTQLWLLVTPPQIRTVTEP